MSSVAITGNAAGAGVFTIASPNSASSFTATLPAATTTLVGTDATQTLTNKTIQGGAITSGTAVASTSGTAIDFTAIPAWVKKITVMFQGTSLSSTESLLVQLGTGSTTYTTSGYLSTGNAAASGGNSIVSSTAGFIMVITTAARVTSGHMVITNISGNNWVASHTGKSDTATVLSGGGDVSLGAVLTAVRITSTGVDTFDAGTVNILFEG